MSLLSSCSLRWKWAVVGSAVALCSGTLHATTNVQYRVLLRDGDPVPGVPGAVYQSFSGPLLNNQGDVLFQARMTGGGVHATNAQVLITGHPGAWSYVARDSEHVKGLPDGVYIAPTALPFSNLRMNDAGFVAFVCQLTGEGVHLENDTCFVWGKPGDMRVVAREGEIAPGTNQEFAHLAGLNGLKLAMGGGNDIAFQAQLATTTGSSAGVWAGPATNLMLLAQDGGAAPGFAGATFQNLIFTTVRLNPSGKLAFSGQTSAFPTDEGVWAGTTNGLQLVFKEGNAIPGLNMTFRGFSSVTVNEKDEYCLVATVDGVPFGTDSVILAGTPGNLKLVAREGYQAPGLPAGVIFEELALVEPLLGARGDVAFTAHVDGPGLGMTNDTAIWAGLPGALKMMCRSGSPAMDMPPGVIYSTAFAAVFDLAGLNAQGNALFKTIVEGSGIGLLNDEGLWGGVPGFESLLLQRGDVIDLGNGRVGEVHMIEIVDINGELQNGGGQDGRARGFNDRNQCAMALHFKAAQGSALVMVDDMTDPDLNGLSRFLERAHGIPPTGAVEHARLQVLKDGPSHKLVFQEAAVNAGAVLRLRETDDLALPWKATTLTVTTSPDQTGVDAGAVRREAVLPVTAAKRFYRLEAVQQ